MVLRNGTKLEQEVLTFFPVLSGTRCCSWRLMSQLTFICQDGDSTCPGSQAFSRDSADSEVRASLDLNPSDCVTLEKSLTPGPQLSYVWNGSHKTPSQLAWGIDEAMHVQHSSQCSASFQTVMISIIIWRGFVNDEIVFRHKAFLQEALALGNTRLLV